MTFRIYDKLCEDAKQIRTEVFVAEQGFETEFDDTDSKARHIVGYDGEKPVAVCRYFYDEEHKSYMIGRIAVIKECRGLHYGDIILCGAEDKAGRRKVGCTVRSASCVGFLRETGL